MDMDLLRYPPNDGTAKRLEVNDGVSINQITEDQHSSFWLQVQSGFNRSFERSRSGEVVSSHQFHIL